MATHLHASAAFLSSAAKVRASHSTVVAALAKHSRRKLRSAAAAQRCEVSSIRVLPDASFQLAAQAGASAASGGLERAHQKELRFRRHHAFSFALRQPVIQPVISWSFLIEAPMEQLPLLLLCRLDAPSVVPTQAIKACATYREAVKLCWTHRRIRNMTCARLAEEAGLYAPHVTGYLNDFARNLRDLPAAKVPAFELACGNTAVSQWLAMQAQLTVAEEAIADRQAGRAAA